MSSRRDFVRFAGAAAAASSLSLPGFVVAAGRDRLATRQIPGADETLPVVGLGNAEVFTSGDMGLSRKLLEILLEYGGSYVDTTGPSRYTIAKIVRELDAGQQTFVGAYVEETNDAAARQDIDSVIAAQGGGSLDLMLTRNIEDYASRTAQYRQLKADGLTRYLGVARHQQRFHEPMMRLIADGVVDFVQVNYSLLETEADERLLPMAQDHGVAIITNRPFINGQWFSIVREKPLPEWAADFDCESWAQFSLKFILSHPAVHCVLTETSNPKHAVDNIGGGIGRLPDAAIRRRMLELVRGFV